MPDHLRTMKTAPVSTRRDFLVRAAAGAAAAAALPGLRPAFAAGNWPPPVCLFTKVYQELKLSFEDAAALTAESGLDGIDCPVRPKGEIEPERAVDDLPRYAAALKARRVNLSLLTTAIVAADSPHAADILRTAKALGVRYYRLGFFQPVKGQDRKLPEIKAQFKGLAALNRELGMTGIFQNHSGNYIGADLGEMYEVVKDLNPDEIGVAFDLCHAIIMHGPEWSSHYERLRPHIRVAYVKDVKRPKEYVPFGEGEFSGTDYFKRLHHLALPAPISMHIEFDWSHNGAARTRPALLECIRTNLAVLRKWMEQA